MFLVPSTRTLSSLSGYYEDSMKIAITKMLNDIAIQGVATTPLYQLPMSQSTTKTLIQMLDTSFCFIIYNIKKKYILIIVLISLF